MSEFQLKSRKYSTDTCLRGNCKGHNTVLHRMTKSNYKGYTNVPKTAGKCRAVKYELFLVQLGISCYFNTKRKREI